MMFSSKPPFNDDPEPLVHASGKRTPTFSYYFEFEPGESGPFGKIATASLDPRPEFDRPQHNPTNTALVHFRQLHGKKPAAELANAAAHWSASLHDMRIAGAYTADEEDHARRVLARLAARHMR